VPLCRSLHNGTHAGKLNYAELALGIARRPRVTVDLSRRDVCIIRAPFRDDGVGAQYHEQMPERRV
jgi:hypothetical protein